MKFLVLFIALVFATEHNTEGNEEIFEQNAYAPILVKIEEDEYAKVKKSKASEYIGVSYIEKYSRWRVSRRRKNDNKLVHYGSYNDEERAAHASDTLARKLMATGEQKLKLNFPDDDTEVYPEEKSTTSKYIGVSYYKKYSRWQVDRWSKNENKKVYYGCYKDEETAAHASDTLARKLMTNGEDHRLNFPDDDTKVHTKKTNTSKYIGVSYNQKYSRWQAGRRSKNAKKMFYNGHYRDEETAAHASDTSARQLIANGEQNHKLNFPDDDTEVHPEKTTTSKYFGVYYYKKNSKWQAQRWSKYEEKVVYNGAYKDEETAAHASDTLARQLIANGEHHKLNFPDDNTEVYPEKLRKNKRKRPDDLDVSQTEENVEK